MEEDSLIESVFEDHFDSSVEKEAYSLNDLLLIS